MKDLLKKLLLVSFLVLVSCAPLERASTEPPTPEAVLDVQAVQPETLKEPWAVQWWMPRHLEKCKRIAEGNVDLLMIGDSITHGWENGGKKVWETFYADRNAVDLGFSGDRTENVLWRLQNGEAKGINPKLAVLMIGTNNAGHREENPEYTAAGIKAIIKELQKRLPETKILLLAIFPRGADDNDKYRKLNMQTNKLIAGFADDKKVFFLDINDKFLAENRVLPKEIMPDLLHPNEKGYHIWAMAMEPHIKKLMGEE